MTTPDDYTIEQVARLAMSYRARSFSENTRAHAHRRRDSPPEIAELTERAMKTREDAAETLRYAVIAEHLRGTSWAQIAERLQEPAEEVERTYAPVAAEFRKAVTFAGRRPATPPAEKRLFPDPLRKPDQLAARLDAWVLGGRERDIYRPPRDAGSTPISRLIHDEGSAPIGPDVVRPVYSEEALSLLSFSAACSDASDLGRFVVARHEDATALPGDLVEKAMRVVKSAENVLVNAVVADRLHGCSWNDIATAAEQKFQSAAEVRAEYEKQVQTFSERVALAKLRPANASLEGAEPMDVVARPVEVAAHLDRWAIGGSEHNTHPVQVPSGVAPVSAVLFDAGLDEMIADKGMRFSEIRRRIAGDDLPRGITPSAATAQQRTLEEVLFGLVEQKQSLGRKAGPLTPPGPGMKSPQTKPSNLPDFGF